MRSWSYRLLLAALVPASFLLGCSDSGRRSSLRVEVAPVCGSSDGLEIGCVQIQVCESDDPDRCIAVAPVGGPYPAPEDDGVTSVLVPVAGGTLRFDVRATPGTLYDIDVVAFGVSEDSPASPVASGRASRVALDGTSSTVRLYQSGSWTCPGEEPGLNLRRAFHQSVPLSNGDALIIGGITFEPGPTGLPVGAGMQQAALVPVADSVLVYDAHDERLYPVTLTGAHTELLARALFQARWIERTMPDGWERVRLYGGVTGSATLTFTSANPYQFPVRATEGAPQAGTLDILYDPATRTLLTDRAEDAADARALTVETESTPLPAAPVTRLGSLVGPLGVDPPAACGTPTPECDPGFRCDMETNTCEVMPQSVTSFGTISAMVDPARLLPLPAARRGGTLTRFGARGFVVYGGNTTQAAADQVSQRALLLESTGAMRSAVLPTSLSTSALHTASVIDDDTVLFVGGLQLDGLTAIAPTGPIVRAYRLAPSDGELTDVPLTGAGETSSERIFHTATTYRAAGATQSSVVVIGGSSREGTSQFWPLGSAYLVDLDASTQIQGLPSLTTPRFGHSAVLLRGGRILVTGGLRRGTTPADESNLYLVDTTELLVVRPLPAPVLCAAGAMDAGPAPTDAGRRVDAAASARDAGVSGDAGSTDDAPVADDAAM